MIPFTVTPGNKAYLDGVNFTPTDMYARYHADSFLPQTAAPNPLDCLDFFSEYHDQGFAVIYLSISSELSNGFIAARQAEEQMSDVYVIDSRMLSTLLSLLTIEAAESR